jgi:hypothetical protein
MLEGEELVFMGRQDVQIQSEQFLCQPYWTYEIFALLGCYETYIVSYLITFRDNLSATHRPFEMGQIGYPETSITTNERIVTF